MAGIITRPLVADLFPLLGTSTNVPSDLSGTMGAIVVANDGITPSGGVLTNKPIPVEAVKSELTGSVVNSFFDDYYNQIWVVPKSLDFGVVSNNTSGSFEIWNAYWKSSTTILRITQSNLEGVSLTGPSAPRLMAPLATVQYTANVSVDGPPNLDGAYSMELSDGAVVQIAVTGTRARLWPAYHNWRDTFAASYAFSTEILTSRSGKEQRIANRLTPRRTLTYERVLKGDDFRAFNERMWSWQNRTFVLPELTRKVVLETPVPGSTKKAELPRIPRWVVVGANVVFVYQDQNEGRIVESIDGNVVTFKTLTAMEWPVGSKLYNGVAGYLDVEISTVRKTNQVATASLVFNVVPLSEPYIDPSEKRGPVFNGREVLELRPNWANDIGVDMQHDYETVDYSRGPIFRFSPITFGVMTRSQTFINRTSEDAENVLEFFHRQLGRQGEFYAPTWDADIVPKNVANAGTSNLRIAGRDFYEAYRGSTVHKAVAVRMLDGTMIYRKVQSIIAVTDAEGSDSIITIEGTWPVAVGPDTIAFISWCLVWCFASDNLTIENLTDEVSQFKITTRSLEDLAPETF